MSAEGSSGGSSCPRCGALSIDDNASFCHFNLWHPSDFVRLLRAQRLHEVFPKADPFIFEVLYDDKAAFPSITPPRSATPNSNTPRVQTHLVNSAVDQTAIQRSDQADAVKEIGNRSRADSQCSSGVQATTPSSTAKSESLSKRSLTPQQVTSASDRRRELNGALENVSSASNSDEERDADKEEGQHDDGSGGRRSNTPSEINDDGRLVVSLDHQGSPTETGERLSVSDESYAERSAVYSDRSSRSRRLKSSTPSGSRSRSRSRSPILGSRSPSPSPSRPRSSGGKRGRFYSTSGRRAAQGGNAAFRGPLTPYTYHSAVFVDRAKEYKDTRVLCLLCTQESENYSAALDHDFKAHPNIRRYPCGVATCAMVSISYKDLIVHLERDHGLFPEYTNLLLECRYCVGAFRNSADYADHVLAEYRRLRRIHYEQIALRSLTLKCKECESEVKGHNWFGHLRRCERVGPLGDIVGDWARQQAHFCKHRRVDCKFFPACTNIVNCRFGHPVCAHYPHCYNRRIGKCPFDHLANERKCRQCE